jgi:hypothetical protein
MMTLHEITISEVRMQSPGKDDRVNEMHKRLSRVETNRTFVARGLLVLLAIAVLSSLAAAGPATRPADPDAELDRVLPDVRLGQLSFGQAVDALRDRSGANLFVNWARLAQVGIKPDLKVELSLHDVTLRQAVVKLVKAARTGDATPAWGVRDGIITVSTRLDLGAESVVTRVYFIKDILDASMVRASPAASQPADPKGREQVLVATIGARLSAEREQEAAVGEAHQGSVQVWAGRLVVTGTRENHRIVRELLEQLREPH